MLKFRHLFLLANKKPEICRGRNTDFVFNRRDSKGARVHTLIIHQIYKAVQDWKGSHEHRIDNSRLIRRRWSQNWSLCSRNGQMTLYWETSIKVLSLLNERPLEDGAGLKINTRMFGWNFILGPSSTSIFGSQIKPQMSQQTLKK